MKNSNNKEKAKLANQKRSDKLDPNNNINLPQNPIIKKPGHKDVHDDGFEHRTSNETL